MKKLVIFGFLLICGFGLKAQQRPQYSQYMINPYVLNPAVGGVENYIDVRAGYRNQWVALDAHPVTFYLSAHAPIGKAMCLNSRTRHRKPGFHGVGGYMMVDKTGPSRRTAGYLSYAYHLMVGKNLFWSLGISGGVQQYRLDHNQLDIVNGANKDSWNRVDPMFASGDRYVRSVPDFTAGTWLYSNDFFLGASISQILAPTLNYDFNGVGSDFKLTRHTFFIGGYRFKVDRDLSIIPSLALKGVAPAPLSFDVNCKVRYMDAYWAGLSYRRGDAIAAMAGIVINKMFDVSYSYDVTLSEIRKYSNGVHEIVVGYRIPLQQNLVCPSHFW